MGNLFDVVRYSMFSVFNGQDRRTNYDLLNHIYLYFTQGDRYQSVPREELVLHLTNYIKDRHFERFEDESGEEISLSPPKDLATYKIRQYIKCGWLEEDSTASFASLLSLNDNAILLLKTFATMIDNRDKPLEYTGYFYTIYNNVANFEIDKSKAMLEQIQTSTESLFDSLQGLNSSIKRFIDEMISSTTLSPQEIFDLFLNKYRNQVILTVFNNLKGRDNPSKYTDVILEKLKDLRDKRLPAIVANYTKTKNVELLTNEVQLGIEEEVLKIFNQVISRFETVDEFIRIIDERNSKFHSATLAKLQFLLNTRRDIDGLLTQAIKSLADASEDNDFEEIISLFQSNNLDEKSTYSRSFQKDRVMVKPYEIPDIDEEECLEQFERILAKDKYSIEKINQYVIEVMDGKKMMSCRDIPLNSFDDLVMLMMIQLKADYPDTVYQVIFYDREYTMFNYRLQTFEIRRKENDFYE